jgi:hypothetical protein
MVYVKCAGYGILTKDVIQIHNRILGSMLLAGAITSIVMTTMAAKKNNSDPRKLHEKLVKDKNAPKMAPMDRYAVLANMRADDTPLSASTTDKTKETTNAPKMSAMDRYSVLSEMKAKDGKPFPELKTKPTTTTATADVLTGGEPFGILSHMKAVDHEGHGERKDRNTEPEEKDRFEVLADMKATRGDDVMIPDKNMASTRAL